MLNVDGRKRLAEQEIAPQVLKYIIYFISDKLTNGSPNWIWTHGFHEVSWKRNILLIALNSYGIKTGTILKK